MAVDMFLEIEGIDGESTDEAHKGEIEVDSWSFGASNPTSVGPGGGGGAGKASWTDFHFSHAIDAASPMLMLRCATGQHIAKATLTVRKAGEGRAEYLKYTLQDCIVSSIAHKDDPGASPMEEFALRYRKIEMDYTPASGAKVHAGWDLATNKKV
jgi:type VI secretion system secreted protein Hcp